jgi:hypothetical protein
MLVCCSACRVLLDQTGCLIPARCLRKNGARAHRVCASCWWDPVRGFAREDAPHDCPGCVAGLPLQAAIIHVEVLHNVGD